MTVDSGAQIAELDAGSSRRSGILARIAFALGLVAAGVPSERIVCDSAGFRTLDSVVRCEDLPGSTPSAGDGSSGAMWFEACGIGERRKKSVFIQRGECDK